ncbi:hypothetical protein WNB94_00600 [Aquabacterium sp. A3]|uniref:hypothetical protein n=1 Tax=Aquabacterium sp. A3 TaxID=3132829 RepID=UPI003119C7C7
MARFYVVGIKRFQGTVDGKQINSGKLFVNCRLDESRNSPEQYASGHFTETIERVDPELIKRIEHVPLPAWFDIETERVGNGKESREMVLDIRPAEHQNLKAAAQPVKAA